MKITYVLLLIFFINESVPAFVTSTLPNNIKTYTSNGLVGNMTKINSGCDGIDPKFLKIIIKPSCYGGNLRHAQGALKPSGEDITLDLVLQNESKTFKTSIKFGSKATWPITHREGCEWSQLSPTRHHITCLDSIEYECNYIKAKSQFSDYLDCTRKDNSLEHKKVNCSFFYLWTGNLQGAQQSYSIVPGKVNCGFSTNGPINVQVENSSKNLETFATRGYVSVVFPSIGINKYTVILDMTTGKYEPAPDTKKSIVSATFLQGSNPLSAKQEISFDQFEQCLIIKASFLGQNKHCGSFY